MRKLTGIALLVILCITNINCTLPSTKMAQEGSFKSQAVTDGVHRDMFGALSRENYEVAKLNILLNAEKAKVGQTSIDASAQKDIESLKEFAVKRDRMVEWDRDHERAAAYKYVTVDAKLFSEQGILNYLGGRLSDGSKKLFSAWDSAKLTWKLPTTQPSETK